MTMLMTPPDHPRKKRRRNKKAKDSTTEEGVAATATKETKAPPTTTPSGNQKPPAPQYCFRCGEADHTVKGCKELGDLRCENHADTKSHKTKACNIWPKADGLIIHPWLL